MKVAQAYRFELDPNDVTAGCMASHAGADRFAYNWALALVKARLPQQARVVEQAVVEGLSAREAEALANTVVVPWTLASLRREWNRAKTDVAPWWAENSKEAYSCGLDRLARGLAGVLRLPLGEAEGTAGRLPPLPQAWQPGLGGLHHRGHRGGRRAPRPPAPPRGDPDQGAHHQAPGPSRRRRRPHPPGHRVRQGWRWYVSFGVQADRAETVPADPASVIGVDVGVTHLAVLSSGEMVPNSKPLSRYARRLGRLQATGARQHKGSKRRVRTRARIARCHAQVADLRVDGLHKLTTRLATTHRTIVVEDLNVAGMTRRPKPVPDPDRPGAHLANRAAAKAGLNRAILDAAPAELRRQFAYKCTWYGARLLSAGRFYPSSKTCSACGTVKAKLSLAERTFHCQCCGVVIDRDLNAAVNLATLAAGISTVAGSGPETPNARTGTVPPREAGAGQPDKTGTASMKEAPASLLVGCDR